MAPINRMRNKNKSKHNAFQRKADISMQVQRIMRKRQEHKAFSIQVSGATISAAGAIVPLSNGVIEGIDITNRSGTTIRVIQQHFHFAFAMNTNDQSARFIIFRDLFNTGTTPTVAEVLPTSGYLSHFSDIRMVQQKRYHILLDRIKDVSVTGPSRVTDHAVLNFSGNIYYNASTAVPAANGKGSLFLLVIGSQNTGLVDYDWQMTFTDS